MDEWTNRWAENNWRERRDNIINIYIIFLFISCVNSSDKTTPFFSSIRLFFYSSIAADVMKRITLAVHVRVYEWMNGRIDEQMSREFGERVKLLFIVLFRVCVKTGDDTTQLYSSFYLFIYLSIRLFIYIKSRRMDEQMKAVWGLSWWNTTGIVCFFRIISYLCLMLTITVH